MRKIAINRAFRFFSAIIELVRALVISKMHNKFGKDTLKTFEFIFSTRSNYRRKMQKIAIYRPLIFFSAVNKLARELLISNMHKTFEQDK